MTLKNAKAIAGMLGFSLTKRDGEFRLAPMGVKPSIAEDRAYYTNSLEDAIDTARFEHSRMIRNLSPMWTSVA